MRVAIALAFILTAGMPATAADSAELAEAQSAASRFLDSRFEPVTDIAGFSEAVQTYLLSRFQGGIAPLSGEYDASDVIGESELPSRRLVAGGRSSAAEFIWYEHGGRGHHQHFVLFETGPGVISPALVVRGDLGQSLDELHTFLSLGQFNDEALDAETHGYW